MPTSDQEQSITAAITAIRNAQELLQQQIDTASDTTAAISLTNLYSSLDSRASQLIHAQNIADDLIFLKTIDTLKSPTGVLQTDEVAIKKLISDVGTAEKIVGYVTQALSFIAKL